MIGNNPETRRHIVLMSIVLLVSLGPAAAANDLDEPETSQVRRTLEPAFEPGSYGEGDEPIALRGSPIAAVTGRPEPKKRSPNFRLPAPRPLASGYVGEARWLDAIDSDRTRAAALATADFDEDGIADLVSGYGTAAGGLLTLHRGNVDSIYPNNRGAKRRRAEGAFTAAPFLTPARVFGLPQSADFVAAGDFNADGHFDVAAAARGGRKLFLLAGDGSGDLEAARTIYLPGAISTFVAGEINRRDGLADLIVGVEGPTGPAVLVFEGPRGALRDEPETIPVLDTPTALALGRVDDKSSVDLAVATGRDVLLVRGRNRAEVASPVIERIIRTETPVQSLAFGDFVWDPERRRELAVLTRSGALELYRFGTEVGEQTTAGEYGWSKISTHALTEASANGRSLLVPVRVSGLPLEELVVFNPASRRMHVTFGEVSEDENDLGSPVMTTLPGEPAAVLPMRLNRDAQSDLVVLTSGATAPWTIESAPGFIFTVTTTADGTGFSLDQAILQTNNNPGPDTIEFDIPGDGPHLMDVGTGLPAITDPVTIDGYSQPGAASNSVPAPGETDAVLKIVINGSGGGVAGLRIHTADAVIRGLVIQRFMRGIEIQGGTSDGTSMVVEGCYIGTDVAGLSGEGNTSDGIFLFNSPDNLIGGTAPEARNVISDNHLDGVVLWGPVSDNNEIRGNYIGLDAAGAEDLGNGTAGVYLSEGSGLNTIGGTAPGAGNVISGNGTSGVYVKSLSNMVMANYLGTDAGGTSGLGNLDSGVFLFGNSATGNTIGGPDFASGGNVISGNGIAGVIVETMSPQQSFVTGNRIGTNATGTAALPNGNGVIVTTHSTNLDLDSNLISGNAGDGIFVDVPTGSAGWTGNLIGTDAEGTVDLGNGRAGVLFSGVGVGTTLSDNVISGNTGLGLQVQQGAMVTLESNRIGADEGGAGTLGNSGEGVVVVDATAAIGDGTDAGSNVIAGNSRQGVVVVAETGFSTAKILSNSIFDNGGLGIDLDGDGVTPNDPGDGDGGPNNRQNCPVLNVSPAATVDVDAGTVTLGGTLDGGSGSFRLEFFSNARCDGSGHGEGQYYLGTATSSSGAFGPLVLSPSPFPAARRITATAAKTAIGGLRVSEFSACVTADCVGAAEMDQTIVASDKNRLTWPDPSDVRYVKGDLPLVGSYATIEEGVLLAATTLDISADNPATGDGLYYLVRPEGCGSWQTVGAEPDRDATLTCGDLFVDAGEDCDDGGDSASCDANCTPAACGDGTLNPEAGEQCDDNGAADGDGCDANCIVEECGNEILQTGAGEECDDGNAGSCDGCSSVCTTETGFVCGDGIHNPSCHEQCDDGNNDEADGDLDNCRADCSLARYVHNGDGTVTDSMTGLIWLRDATCRDIPLTDDYGMASWADAIAGLALLADGTCGLADGSSAGDWRLPTKSEWESAIAPAIALGCSDFPVPGNPPSITNAPGTACHADGPPAFVDVDDYYYWSSTEKDDNEAWRVSLNLGYTSYWFKIIPWKIWPVREP